MSIINALKSPIMIYWRNKMKKWTLTLGALAAGVALAGCGADKKEESKTETVVYEQKDGTKIDVPKDPKRIVVLGRYTGDVLKFDGDVVGCDTYSKQDPLFKDDLKDAKVISEDNVEDIAELKPDLIIGLSTAKNADKIKKIAPTVLFNYGEYNYLDQPVEVAKVLNKEKEGKEWQTSFKKEMATTGKAIKKKMGNQTISIIENFNKDLTLFGDNWARGGEILYQGMNLKMPAPAKKLTAKAGTANISVEALPKYVGDYLIVSKNNNQSTAFMESSTYKNLPAVKNKKVFVVDAAIFNFNDAMTLDYQLDYFKQHLS